MAKEDALSYPRDKATSFTGLPAINHARALTTQARCRQAENDRPSCFRKWRRKVLGLINSAPAQRAAGSWIVGLSKKPDKAPAAPDAAATEYQIRGPAWRPVPATSTVSACDRVGCRTTVVNLQPPAVAGATAARR